jgi:hypothetical protein
MSHPTDGHSLSTPKRVHLVRIQSSPADLRTMCTHIHNMCRTGSRAICWHQPSTLKCCELGTRTIPRLGLPLVLSNRPVSSNEGPPPHTHFIHPRSFSPILRLGRRSGIPSWKRCRPHKPPFFQTYPSWTIPLGPLRQPINPGRHPLLPPAGQKSFHRHHTGTSFQLYRRRRKRFPRSKYPSLVCMQSKCYHSKSYY